MSRIEGSEHMVGQWDRVGILRNPFRQRLDCDFASKRRVARTPDFAHPAFADSGKDFVMAESCAGSERHRVQAGHYIGVFTVFQFDLT